MAQDINLSLRLDTGKATKEVKAFRGSLSTVVREMNKFRSTKLSKQFKDVDFVIDQATEKLLKFEKVIGGKNLSLAFKNIAAPAGGRFRNEAGQFTSAAEFERARKPQLNIQERKDNKLRQTVVSLTGSLHRLRESVVLINREFRKLLRGATIGGGGSAGGGGGTAGSASGGRNNGLQKFSAQFAGAVGFSAIDFGNRITQLFADRRVQGSFQSAFSSLFGQIGNIFGSTVADIATDIGKAFGAFAEIGLNALTQGFRRTGVILGALAKSVGFTVVSGLFSAFFTGGLPSKLLSGVAFLFTSVINVVGGLFTEFVNDFVSVIQNVGTIGVSILTATVKGLVSVMKNIAESIRNIWTALWKGLTDIVSTAIDTIISAIQGAIKQLKKFGTEGVKAFIDLELGSTKVGKELFSLLDGQDLSKGIRAIAQQASVLFGSETGDVLGSLFDFASSDIGKQLISQNGIKAIRDFSRGVGEAAASDLAAVEDVGKAALTILSNFPEQFEDSGDAARFLASATTNARADINDFAGAIGNVIPNAAALGLTLDETVGSFSILTQKLGAGKAKNATTILSRLFETIADPNSSTAQNLLDRGFDVRGIFDAAKDGEKLVTVLREVLDFSRTVDPEILNTIFTTIQSRRAFRSIAPELDQFDRIVDDINKGVNSVRSQAVALLNTTGKTIDRFVNSFNVLRTLFGEIISSVFKRGVEESGLLKTFQEFALILTSNSFNSQLPTFIEDLTFAFQPLFDVLATGVMKLKEFAKAIASGDLEGDDTFQGILDMVRDINTSVAEVITGFVDSIAPVNDLISTLEVVSGLMERIKMIAKELFSGNIDAAIQLGTGKNSSELFVEIRSMISRLAEFLLFSLSNAINRLSAFVLDVDVPDFQLTGPAKALKAVVDSLFDLLTSLMIRGAASFIGVIDQLLKSLLNSDNPIVRAAVDSLIGKGRTLLDRGQFLNDVRNNLQRSGVDTSTLTGKALFPFAAVGEAFGSFVPGTDANKRFEKRQDNLARFGTREGLGGEAAGLFSKVLTSLPTVEDNLRSELKQDQLIQSTDAVREELSGKLQGVIDAVTNLSVAPAPVAASPAGPVSIGAGLQLDLGEGSPGIFTNGSVHENN